MEKTHLVGLSQGSFCLVTEEEEKEYEDLVMAQCKIKDDVEKHRNLLQEAIQELKSTKIEISLLESDDTLQGTTL
jgi:hypothetical protein